MTENASFSRQILCDIRGGSYFISISTAKLLGRHERACGEWRRMLKNCEKVIVMEIDRHLFRTISMIYRSI